LVENGPVDALAGLETDPHGAATSRFAEGIPWIFAAGIRDEGSTKARAEFEKSGGWPVWKTIPVAPSSLLLCLLKPLEATVDVKSGVHSETDSLDSSLLIDSADCWRTQIGQVYATDAFHIV